MTSDFLGLDLATTREIFFSLVAGQQLWVSPQLLSGDGELQFPIMGCNVVPLGGNMLLVTPGWYNLYHFNVGDRKIVEVCGLDYINHFVSPQGNQTLVLSYPKGRIRLRVETALETVSPKGQLQTVPLPLVEEPEEDEDYDNQLS